MKAMSPTRRASTRRMKAARPLLAERSGGRCDKCALPLEDFQMHHRLSRARGGGDGLANLLAVHGPGSGIDCHAAIHARPALSELHGWILPSGSNPEDCALSFRGDAAILGDDGSVYWLDPVSDEDPDSYRDSLIDDELDAS